MGYLQYYVKAESLASRSHRIGIYGIIRPGIIQCNGREGGHTRLGTICLRDLPPMRAEMLMVRGPMALLSCRLAETTSFCTMRRAMTRRRWLMVLISSGPYTSSSAARPGDQSQGSENLQFPVRVLSAESAVHHATVKHCVCARKRGHWSKCSSR